MNRVELPIDVDILRMWHAHIDSVKHTLLDRDKPPSRRINEAYDELRELGTLVNYAIEIREA